MTRLSQSHYEGITVVCTHSLFRQPVQENRDDKYDKTFPHQGDGETS